MIYFSGQLWFTMAHFIQTLMQNSVLLYFLRPDTIYLDFCSFIFFSSEKRLKWRIHFKTPSLVTIGRVCQAFDWGWLLTWSLTPDGHTKCFNMQFTVSLTAQQTCVSHIKQLTVREIFNLMSGWHIKISMQFFFAINFPPHFFPLSIFCLEEIFTGFSLHFKFRFPVFNLQDFEQLAIYHLTSSFAS